MEKKEKLEKFLNLVQKDVSLSEKTTFQVGGKAKYYFVVKNKSDLVKILKLSRELSIPFFILGEGSNILFLDRGYDGLIIEIGQNSLKKEDDYQDSHNLCFWPGEKVSPLSKTFLDHSLLGMEWAFGLPGTIGAAVYGNSGAFGKSIGDIVEKIEAFDLRSGEVVSLENKDCHFSYKNSLFKENNGLIILSVCLKSKKGKKEEIEKEMKRNLSYRKNNQPLNFPSAGSIFKNFIISKGKINKKSKEVEKALLEFSPKGIIPAGYLIDRCGLKGKRIGRAEISKKHANFIINLGGAEASDILELIKIAKEEVRNKFGINLEEEVIIVK